MRVSAYVDDELAAGIPPDRIILAVRRSRRVARLCVTLSETSI